jgi:transposase
MREMTVEDARPDPRLEARDEARPYERIELITGRRLRRAWSPAEKARIVTETAQPGANISEIARRHGLNRGLLTVWRRQVGLGAKAAPPEAAPAFVPITVTDPAGQRDGAELEHDACGTGRIDVNVREARLVLVGHVDPELAAAVIAALRAQP